MIHPIPHFWGCYCDVCNSGEDALLVRPHNEDMTLTSDAAVSEEILAERSVRLKAHSVGWTEQEIEVLVREPMLTVPGWVAAKIAPLGYRYDISG